MQRWIILVMCAGLLACGSDDTESDANGAAGGGASGDEQMDCVFLYQDMFTQLQEAAVCDPDVANSCTGEVTVVDNCGCELVMNDAADADALRDAVETFVENCDGEQGCAGVMCVSADTADCFDVGDGAGPRCRWIE